MEKKFTYPVTAENIARTDGLVRRILSRELGFSRREISRLKFQEGLWAGDRPVRVNEHLQPGECLTAVFHDTGPAGQDSSRPCEILYEDEDVAVLAKPAGIPVHPSHGHLDDSLGSALRSYCHQQGRDTAIRAVGRLDKDVSGTVLFALNQPAAARLNAERQEGRITKTYLALAMNDFPEKEGTWCDPIVHVPGQRRRKAGPMGKPALTRYRVLDRFEQDGLCYCLLAIQIETGRTHQIRVHASVHGHPLLGDSLYGGNTDLIRRTALHAGRLAFLAPFSRMPVQVEAALPDDMARLIKRTGSW